jgi:hypothetical protein
MNNGILSNKVNTTTAGAVFADSDSQFENAP